MLLGQRGERRFVGGQGLDGGNHARVTAARPKTHHAKAEVDRAGLPRTPDRFAANHIGVLGGRDASGSRQSARRAFSCDLTERDEQPPRRAACRRSPWTTGSSPRAGASDTPPLPGKCKRQRGSDRGAQPSSAAGVSSASAQTTASRERGSRCAVSADAQSAQWHGSARWSTSARPVARKSASAAPAPSVAVAPPFAGPRAVSGSFTLRPDEWAVMPYRTSCRRWHL